MLFDFFSIKLFLHMCMLPMLLFSMSNIRPFVSFILLYYLSHFTFVTSLLKSDTTMNRNSSGAKFFSQEDNADGIVKSHPVLSDTEARMCG